MIRDLFEGSYTIDGDNITFRLDDKSAAKTDCDNAVFTYKWSFDTKTNLLTFKPGDDTCSTRIYGFTYGRWAYSKLSQ